MTKYKFYDTCSLLLKVDEIFEDTEYFPVISSITLNELERIKTSTNKDEQTKFSARKLLHIFDENKEKYICWIFKTSMLTPIIEKDLDITDDMRILSCAIDFDNQHPDTVTFVTNDMALKQIANLFFGTDSIDSVKDESDKYKGFKKLYMTDEEMADFYSNITTNKYDLLVNEYAIIYNSNGEVVDTVCWTGETHRPLKYATFSSMWLGDVKPIKGDYFQQMVADSFVTNKLTMVKGPAGSGKTYLSLAYLLSQLNHHKIDKIIVFCNTVATKNSAKLGFYPGTRDEKLLDSQIGNLLSSKLGGKLAVEQMIQ